MAKNLLGRLACLAVLVTPTLSAIMSRVYPPSKVRLMKIASDDQIISLSIGLALENIDQLEDKLKAVSTPGSSEYGKYLDKDDIESLFPVSSDATNAVMDWLKRAGVESISHQGTSINFATTVKTANALLNTTFAYYNIDGVSKLRTRQYSIPDNLVEHIDLIHPTTFFGRTVSAKMPTVDLIKPVHGLAPFATNSTTNCSALITPSCLRHGYNIGHYKPDPLSGSRVGFGSFLNESAQFSDLNLYQAAYGIPQQNFSVVLINGGVNSQNGSGSIGEADLDAEFLNAISYPLPMTEYITGGSPPFIPNLDEKTPADNTNEPYLEYYQFLLSQNNSDIPQVLTQSYGDDEQTVPKDYAIRVCNLIGMMGMRGISVLESSGDTGVGAPCLSNDGKNKTEFTPSFPASCPYITAIGGTQSWAPEVAWDGSTGGFSSHFPQAWYQADAVKQYLDSGINPEAKTYYEAGSFVNFSGRGFPDISAHSLTPYFDVFVGGGEGGTGGTSAASPVVAGIIGLLNDARLRAGKPTMGFLNPFLYSLKPGVLTDVTQGAAIGCNGVNSQSGEAIPGGGIIPYATWNATQGWDPVTGLGLPNFQNLVKAALDAC